MLKLEEAKDKIMELDKNNDMSQIDKMKELEKARKQIKQMGENHKDEREKLENKIIENKKLCKKIKNIVKKYNNILCNVDNEIIILSKDIKLHETDISKCTYILPYKFINIVGIKLLSYEFPSKIYNINSSNNKFYFKKVSMKQVDMKQIIMKQADKKTKYQETSRHETS